MLASYVPISSNVLIDSVYKSKVENSKASNG